MNSYSFLFWAYTVVWLCLAGFIGFIFQRMLRTNRRLDGLEAELSKLEAQHKGRSDG